VPLLSRKRPAPGRLLSVPDEEENAFQSLPAGIGARWQVIVHEAELTRRGEAFEQALRRRSVRRPAAGAVVVVVGIQVKNAEKKASRDKGRVHGLSIGGAAGGIDRTKTRVLPDPVVCPEVRQAEGEKIARLIGFPPGCRKGPREFDRSRRKVETCHRRDPGAGGDCPDIVPETAPGDKNAALQLPRMGLDPLKQGAGRGSPLVPRGRYFGLILLVPVEAQ